MKVKDLIKSLSQYDQELDIIFCDSSYNNLDDDEVNYDLPERKKMIILNVDGLILNIWKYDEGSDWSCIKDSETRVYVATVNHIIEAKKKYARDKDFKDIYKIIKGLV